jgi:hypothetical protein
MGCGSDTDRRVRYQICHYCNDEITEPLTDAEVQRLLRIYRMDRRLDERADARREGRDPAPYVKLVRAIPSGKVG